MSLLLVTGFCGMIAGARGWPGTGLAVAAMVGLALACGGASALNHVLDRDIDPLMGERTSARPVASGRVAPSRALEFGLALSAFSFVLLASAVNVLTAVLALVGGLFYVVVYTRWLKRSTSQNIVIGGAAGAVPPLVGWAAATGQVGIAALLLFAIVFIWTPPHFWALALLIKDNYANARVPMLPVVRGERETARQIVLYSLVLVAATLLPWALGRRRPALRRLRARARRRLRLARRAAAARHDAAARDAPLPLLAPVPRAALRGAGRGRGDRLMDPELARRNVRLGWMLFGVFLLLFAGSHRGRVPVPPLRLVDGIWLRAARTRPARASRSRSRICSTRRG